MTKPEFKLFPCVFCTIGFNCYVAGHKIVASAYDKFSEKNKIPPQLEVTLPKSDNKD